MATEAIFFMAAVSRFPQYWDARITILVPDSHENILIDELDLIHRGGPGESRLGIAAQHNVIRQIDAEGNDILQKRWADTAAERICKIVCPLTSMYKTPPKPQYCKNPEGAAGSIRVFAYTVWSSRLISGCGFFVLFRLFRRFPVPR